MSPLRKVIKNKNATKPTRHEVAQRVEYQQYILSETLSLSAFMAKKGFSEVAQL